MHAAEDGAVLLDTVPDDAVAAMRASWRKRLNRALKRVKRHGAARHRHLKALVVVVPALVASSHLGFSQTDCSVNPLELNEPCYCGCTGSGTGGVCSGGMAGGVCSGTVVGGVAVVSGGVAGSDQTTSSAMTTV